MIRLILRFQSLNLDVKLILDQIESVKNYPVPNIAHYLLLGNSIKIGSDRSGSCLNLWVDRSTSSQKMKKISAKTSQVILNTLFWLMTILWLSLAVMIFLTCRSSINCSICLLLALGTVPLLQINQWLRLAIIAFGISWSESVVAMMQFCH